jgi:outer membrane protein assembly factor BamD
MKSPLLRKFAPFVTIACLFLTQCSSKQVNKDDPEAVYKDAEAAYTDEHYISALEKFKDVKNRFPYSSRAVDAELRIADTFFEQENYLEAESAYEIFRELHPTHSRSDYVQYRIGLSYYKQIPDNTARDLSAAYRAIDAFQVLVDKFPSSEFAPKGKELISESRKKLAEHENYVANFYYQRKHYLSASYRYAALLQDYPGLGYDEEALYRLGKCYYNVKMYSNAQDAFKRLVLQFPNTSYKGEVQSLVDEMTKKT